MTTPWKRHERVGMCDLYLGDCMEILPTLGKVDAVVTDPPYGIRADETPIRGKSKHAAIGWDRLRPPEYCFTQILRIAPYSIIWGGNYFTDILPPSQQWLIWDKQNGDFSLADAEMAWSSQWRATRIFRYSGAKRIARDGAYHPTQKPVELMKWCIKRLPADVESILDPFMGSATTGVACVKLGRKFIGVEICEEYFEIACERIRKAYAQPDMFIEAEKQPKPEQISLLEAGE